jgi:hypothetical protein
MDRRRQLKLSDDSLEFSWFRMIFEMESIENNGGELADKELQNI